MAPRTRNTLPEFLTSGVLGDIVAAELETLAADSPHVEHGAPALDPRERARRSMLNRAAAEIRAHHQPDDGAS